MRLIPYTLTVVTASMFALPAEAATTIKLTPIGNNYVGVFGDLNPSGTGTDVFTFDLPTNGKIEVGAISVGFRLLGTNLDLKSITLNGTPFNIDSTGIVELQSISEQLSAGLQTLSVTYAHAQECSFYTGAFFFEPSAVTAVPESATWLIMMVGVAAIGAAVRYRQRTTVAFV